MNAVPPTTTGSVLQPPKRYRLPGIEREGIAQLSLLETALWPLQGGTLDASTFHSTYSFQASNGKHEASVTVYAPLGLQSIDEYVLWGLLALSLSSAQPEPTLLATPYWIIKKLGMAIGGFQYDQLRASLERLALVAYQNTAFYNPLTQEHERTTLHFFSSFLPLRGASREVDADRAWRIEWSPRFFQMCRATGGTLLFDLELYRNLSPAARRLFLKLKDRFWRKKCVFLNVEDLTINGLGFSAARPLKKRKFDLTQCIRELLAAQIVELGKGQTDPKELFLKRGKGSYVVAFYEGAYFRQPSVERATGPQNAFREDPLFEPLRKIGVDEPGIRRLFKQQARGNLQKWICITDAAMHERPRGFPGFKVSPAAFLIDALQHNRLPPDWVFVHDKERERSRWEKNREAANGVEAQERQAYQSERANALEDFLATREGSERYEAYSATFQELYRFVEPDQFREAARKAAIDKIEREHFHFPAFGVWLLERGPAAI